MKITSVSLKNVKCFKEDHFDLNIPETSNALPTCVFVGANGSGKSSILKAIVAAFSGLDPRYAGDMMHNEDIFWNSDFLEVKLCLALNNHEKKILRHNSHFVEINYQHARTVGTGKDSLNCPSGMNTDTYEKLIGRLTSDMRTGIIMYYDPFRFLSIQNPVGPNLQLEKDAKSNALRSNISAEGINAFRDLELKQWMVNTDYQKLKDPTVKNVMIYDQMVKAFDILMNPLKFKNIDTNGAIIFEDKLANENLSLDMLSDGFKSVFFIAIDIIRRLSLSEPFEGEPFYMKEAIVLIDEIDCHIHPKWQKRLLPSLRELFPNCQFIVTTHSPYILDSISEYSVKKVGERQII